MKKKKKKKKKAMVRTSDLEEMQPEIDEVEESKGPPPLVEEVKVDWEAITSKNAAKKGISKGETVVREQ